jgi:hypothetical protein
MNAHCVLEAQVLQLMVLCTQDATKCAVVVPVISSLLARSLAGPNDVQDCPAFDVQGSSAFSLFQSINESSWVSRGGWESKNAD